MPSPTPDQSGPPADAPVYSVRKLNREAKRLLEGNFPGIWVSGEISRFTHHGSGHMYFDLKDADAQISCAMFRGSQRSLRFKPASGQQVILQGKVSIFEARGNYQIIVERMEEAGEGLLRRQLEELKTRLQHEGLFASEHKVAPPDLPTRIGVITSPTGAAIRDILHILQRRYPIAEVIIYPVRVQGEGAREEIAAAIATANARAECDVLIVGRGGGSLEDLWAFNEEVVARAIFASRLPLISAVGHEIDFTLADLAADVRAPTPSGAAEIVAPDRQSLSQILYALERRAGLSAQRMLNGRQEKLQTQKARLRRMHPETILRDMQQNTDELLAALARGLQRCFAHWRTRWTTANQRLLLSAPDARLTNTMTRRSQLDRQLRRAMDNRLHNMRQQFTNLATNLNTVSPLATLDRGYAIVRKSDDSRPLTSIQKLKKGDEIEAQLADGCINATVTGTQKE